MATAVRAAGSAHAAERRRVRRRRFCKLVPAAVTIWSAVSAGLSQEGAIRESGDAWTPPLLSRGTPAKQVVEKDSRPAWHVRHHRRGLCARGCVKTETEVLRSDVSYIFPEKASQKQDEPAANQRWDMLVFALFLAYALCDLDKVNLSVAVLPIQSRFGLTESDVGIASSAFFWGYMLTQLPAASLMQSVPGGPATVLAIGVFIQSIGTVGTALLDSVASDQQQTALLILCVSRCFVGFGEGIGLPTIGALLALLPEQRRSSGTGITYAGSTTGVALGLLLCPFLIEQLGWPVVFWSFAAAGLLWTLWWAPTSKDILADGPSSDKGKSAGSATNTGSVPWAEIVKSPGVWSVIATHAMSNIGFYSLLAWVPTWYSKGLGLNMELAGICAFLPYLFGALASPVVGKFADGLIADGWEVVQVRRTFQGIAFFGPATCMLLNATVGPSLGTVAQVGLLILATTLKSGDRAGLFCTHADLSPRYAGALLAASTTAGAIAPIGVIAWIGQMIDATGSFSQGLFLPVATAQILGGLIYVFTSSSERQSFDRL